MNLLSDCRTALLACLLALGSLMVVAPAAAQAAREGENVSLNFNNADINAVVTAIGKLSGRNFIVDPRVKGTLNIVTNQPVPRSMTYSILLSALRLQGYAAVENGNIVKIVPEADAKLHGVPVAKDRRAGSGDRIVTEVFQIKHESAAQLVQVIRPLVTPNNPVTVYPGNNSLVVTDYAQNVARVAQIIASIDVPQGDSNVIAVQHASAIDLAGTLNRLFADAPGGQPGDPSQRVTILAEPRSNALLVRTENRSRLQAVRSMASQLDKPGAAGTVRVIYLKNADATRVAQTLRAALASDPAAAGQPAAAPQGQAGQQGNQPANAGPGGGAVLGGSVFADTANNALVITGPDTVYNSVRRVVEQLDRRPAQVYVEALIAEMSANRAAEFGIQWQSGVPTNGGTTVFGGTNFGGVGQNILGISANPATAGRGLNFIVGSGAVNIPGVGTIFELSALARFLESEADSNILSTPSLVTVDNEEAKIVVGQNLPFITGQYTNTGGGSTPANPFQTIERRDVGLTLRIRPQITEGGTIRLRIYQEASSIANATNPAGPITNTRTLESTVVADDGAIIALGGLIRDEYSGGREKVPLLGDIPVIGSLFRYDTRSRGKTNLMIFLRPRVIRTTEDAQGLAQDRYDYILNRQQAQEKPERLMRGEEGGPRLPPVPVAPTPAIPATPPAPVVPAPMPEIR